MDFRSKPQGVAPAGQPEAHEENVGLVKGSLREELGACGGLANDFESPVRFERRSQAEKKNGFAVRK